MVLAVRSRRYVMNKPSSTITAAALAGLGMTAAWEIVLQLNLLGAPVRSTLVAATTAFVIAAFGYFKKEKVLK